MAEAEADEANDGWDVPISDEEESAPVSQPARSSNSEGWNDPPANQFVSTPAKPKAKPKPRPQVKPTPVLTSIQPSTSAHTAVEDEWGSLDATTGPVASEASEATDAWATDDWGNSTAAPASNKGLDAKTKMARMREERKAVSSVPTVHLLALTETA